MYAISWLRIIYEIIWKCYTENFQWHISHNQCLVCACIWEGVGAWQYSIAKLKSPLLSAKGTFAISVVSFFGENEASGWFMGKQSHIHHYLDFYILFTFKFHNCFPVHKTMATGTSIVWTFFTSLKKSLWCIFFTLEIYFCFLWSLLHTSSVVLLQLLSFSITFLSKQE